MSQSSLRKVLPLNPLQEAVRNQVNEGPTSVPSKPQTWTPSDLTHRVWHSAYVKDVPCHRALPGSWTSATIALATPVNELTTVHSAAPTLTSSDLTHGKYACGAELASNRSKPLQPLQRLGLCRRENRRCPVTVTAKTLNSRRSCNSALSIRSPRRQSEHLFHDGLVFAWGAFAVFCAVCTMGSCTCLATGISM